PASRVDESRRAQMEDSTVSRDATTPAAVDAATLGEALRRTAAAHPHVVAVRTLDDDVSLTWGELRTRVNALARGLAGLGVGRGETVALMMGNRPEFHLCDLAAATLGAAPFSIYQTFTVEQIAYVVGDAGARVAIVEQAHLPVLLEAKRQLPALAHVIVVDGEAPADGGRTLDELERAGRASGFDLDKALAAVSAGDVATLIYTSGTTGPPKGVELSHANIFGAVRAVQAMIELPLGAKVISWLPAAHIAERMAHH